MWRTREKIPLTKLTRPSQVQWRAVTKGGKRKSGKNEKNEKGKERGGTEGRETQEGREEARERETIELCLEMHAATSGFGLKIRDVFDASMA